MCASRGKAWRIFLQLFVVAPFSAESSQPLRQFGEQLWEPPRGSFNNYVDSTLTTFPPRVDNCGHFMISNVCSCDHLPTSNCPSSYWMPPCSPSSLCKKILCFVQETIYIPVIRKVGTDLLNVYCSSGTIMKTLLMAGAFKWFPNFSLIW